MKTHWLYGIGDDKRLNFAKEVDVESDCGTCIHRKVCARKMEERCENFKLSTSGSSGCGSCLHHYTRFDKDSVPCFSCRDHLPEKPPV